MYADRVVWLSTPDLVVQAESDPDTGRWSLKVVSLDRDDVYYETMDDQVALKTILAFLRRRTDE